MKKVGIITLYHGNNNYGGILQAYALNRTVRRLGYICRTIDYIPTSMPVKEKVKRKISQDGVLAAAEAAVRLTLKGTWKKIVRRCTPSVTKQIQQREEKMRAFREGQIPHTENSFHSGEIARAAEEFDTFLCGSDQIWNMGCAGTFDPVYWLDFVPAGKRKASYAASMPLPEIPASETENIRNRVKKLDAVSVREEQGKNLLEPLRGEKIPIVLDPVFLVERSHFEELAAQRVVKEPYVFVYLLGDRKDARKETRKWAKAGGFQIACIPHVLSEYRSCDKGFGDIHIRDAGPEEFLSLIRYAECVITDSFHAAVFSAVFHKEFRVFNRTGSKDKRSMNTRMEHLMELLGTPKRLVEPEHLSESFADCKTIDYDQVDRNLEQEKEKSLEYLRYALRGKAKDENRENESKSA